MLEALEGLDGKATQSELAEATGKHRPDVYKQLQELIRKGLVVKGQREGHSVPYILVAEDARLKLL